MRLHDSTTTKNRFCRAPTGHCSLASFFGFPLLSPTRTCGGTVVDSKFFFSFYSLYTPTAPGVGTHSVVIDCLPTSGQYPSLQLPHHHPPSPLFSPTPEPHALRHRFPCSPSTFLVSCILRPGLTWSGRPATLALIPPCSACLPRSLPQPISETATRASRVEPWRQTVSTRTGPRTHTHSRSAT